MGSDPRPLNNSLTPTEGRDIRSFPPFHSPLPLSAGLSTGSCRLSAGLPTVLPPQYPLICFPVLDSFPLLCEASSYSFTFPLLSTHTNTPETLPPGVSRLPPKIVIDTRFFPGLGLKIDLTLPPILIASRHSPFGVYSIICRIQPLLDIAAPRRICAQTVQALALPPPGICHPPGSHRGGGAVQPKLARRPKNENYVM